MPHRSAHALSTLAWVWGATLLGCAPAPLPASPPAPPEPATPLAASAEPTPAPAPATATPAASPAPEVEPASAPLVAVADEALYVSERSECTWLVGSWQRFEGAFPRPFEVRDPASAPAPKHTPAGYDGSMAEMYGLLGDHLAGLRIHDPALKEIQKRAVSVARDAARELGGSGPGHLARLAAVGAKEKRAVDDLNRACIKYDVGDDAAVRKVVKGCKAGDPAMCGLAASTAGSIEMARRGCTLKNGLSCLMVAVMENKVHPGGPLTPESDKALRKVCEMGQADACAVLGMAYVAGLGVPAAVGPARHELERACGAGSDNACDIVATLPFTRKRAELLLRACRVGHTAACERLATEPPSRP